MRVMLKRSTLLQGWLRTTRINLRKAYMIKELEVEGYSVQSLEIGGNTRDFEVLPRNPLHRMGQRVHCLCSHVKKVRSACLGVDA
jgi:hypothetical protein